MPTATTTTNNSGIHALVKIRNIAPPALPATELEFRASGGRYSTADFPTWQVPRGLPGVRSGKLCAVAHRSKAGEDDTREGDRGPQHSSAAKRFPVQDSAQDRRDDDSDFPGRRDCSRRVG